GYLSRSLRLQSPGAALGKYESHEAGSRRHSQKRILDGRNAADLYDWNHRPLNSLNFPSRSSDCISVEPTRNRFHTGSSRSMSERVWMPLAEIGMTSDGISGNSRSLVARSISKVERSRLLINSTVGDTASARVSSSTVWTSTTGVIPRSTMEACNSLSCGSSRILTMSNTACAPARLASCTCKRSRMKSLHRVGRGELALTWDSSSMLPPKY